MKTRKGNEIKITKAGYLYINGVKHDERKIDPFYDAGDIAKQLNDFDIMDYASSWSNKNYRMAY